MLTRKSSAQEIRRTPGVRKSQFVTFFAANRKQLYSAARIRLPSGFSSAADPRTPRGNCENLFARPRLQAQIIN